jgi:hypothetical protein
MLRCASLHLWSSRTDLTSYLLLGLLNDHFPCGLQSTSPDRMKWKAVLMASWCAFDVSKPPRHLLQRISFSDTFLQWNMFYLILISYHIVRSYHTRKQMRKNGEIMSSCTTDPVVHAVVVLRFIYFCFPRPSLNIPQYYEADMKVCRVEIFRITCPSHFWYHIRVYQSVFLRLGDIVKKTAHFLSI